MTEWFIIAILIYLTISAIFNIYRMICIIYNKENPKNILFPLLSFTFMSIIFVAMGSIGYIATGLAMSIAIFYCLIGSVILFWYLLVNE